ncbi:replication initiation factor domain-containing protein, partial [Peribacillus muralis]
LDATIDKLTVLADIAIHKDEFVERVQSLGFEMQEYKSNNYGYSHVFMHEHAGRIEIAEQRKLVDAQDLSRKRLKLIEDIKRAKQGQAHENALSIGEMESILENIQEQLAQCDERGCLDRLKDVRYEFNPKYYECFEGVREASQGALSMLDKQSQRISQIHLAFDYHVQISDLSIIDTKSRKETIIKGRTKKLETMYLGTRSGRNHVCIYDKKQENKDKGTLDQYGGLTKVTRFEARLRNDYARNFKEIDFNPFEGLLVYHLETIEQIGNDESMKWDEKAKLMYLLKNPSALNEMGKNVKPIWKKKLATLTRIDINPIEDFGQKKYSLVGKLESIIGKTLDSN